MEKFPAVYILDSRPNGTLYIGVTSDLPRRVRQHQYGEICGFTSRYQVHRLAWFEYHARMESAIRREKGLKKWNRAWKIRLIERNNPTWNDWTEDLE